MKKLAILLALPLGACIHFGAKPPSTLLSLRSDASIAAGKTQSTADARSITIDVPTVSQELATPRVPVSSGPTAIAYVADAQWVEVPSRMFARLLSDTVAARTGRVVLTARQSLSDPGTQLSGALRAFGVDADAREAVVIYDAALVRDPAQPVYEKRRFEARVPVQAIKPAQVGVALNQAANKVADEVAEWVGS